ncbi:transporter substrate-binding domain-containing protein [Synechocystis sp. PCC 7509]|uniref:transporter substrate-binding domain-containing protein n=1 Tax=Synechocystis sp. PCC 7509 TaxID=927677 RepID=UPI0002AC0125|nr:transporter substrate-binding domain-containing protein [Synechocystis sp. PCC 7509]
MQLKGKRIVIFLIAFYCGFLSFCGACSAAELKEIQRRGYLTVAVKDNLRPLGFRDGQENLQGLEIDLARRLAQDLLGKPESVKLQPTENNLRLSAVLEDKVDIAIADYTATESRARLVSFSLPYYFDGTALITKDAAIQKLSDVVRGKIAVINGSSTIASIRYLLPQVQLVGVDSYQAGKKLLEANGAVAFAGDASVLTGWKQQNEQYRLLPSLIGAEPLAVVMPKGLQYDELRRQVNYAIARYVSEGWLEERVNYWGLPNSISRLRSGKMEQDVN